MHGTKRTIELGTANLLSGPGSVTVSKSPDLCEPPFSRLQNKNNHTCTADIKRRHWEDSDEIKSMGSLKVCIAVQGIIICVLWLSVFLPTSQAQDGGRVMEVVVDFKSK